MKEKEAIASLVKLYTQEESLKEEIKGEKDAIKEAGHDVSILSTVAKAIVKNNVDEMLEKNEAVAKSVQVARS